MGLFISAFCFLALWIWSKLEKYQSPTEREYDEMCRKMRKGEIPFDEYIDWSIDRMHKK